MAATPDFTAATKALATVREQAGYLWKDARSISFDYDMLTGEVVVFDAYISINRTQPAKKRDIGRSWTKICRDDLAAAMADYYRSGAVTLDRSGLHVMILI